VNFPKDESLMNLTNLVRLCGAVAIAWTLVAMGAGMVGLDSRPSADVNFFLAERSLHGAVAVSPATLPGLDEYRLVDRSTGRSEPFPLPEGERWGCVSVSPWRDQDGGLEVIGRWNRLAGAEERAFCGLGWFRLSDPSIVHRIELDVIPTGRPCWVPDRPGEFLFPAGDGRLYRCHLTRGEDADKKAPNRSREESRFARANSPRPVVWKCAEPGFGCTFMADPVWPVEKDLRRFVFVSLALQSRHDNKRRLEPSRIWWLEMSEGGQKIVSAGPLTEPAPYPATGRSVIEQMPNVSVGPSGRLTLAYLKRAQRKTGWRLCLAELALDKATGKPKIAARPETVGDAVDDLVLSPPMFSTDGQAVFASAEGGQIKRYSLLQGEPSSSRRAPEG
jgi:hypothetical protein